MKEDVTLFNLIRFWIAYPLFVVVSAIGGPLFKRIMTESFTEALGSVE